MRFDRVHHHEQRKQQQQQPDPVPDNHKGSKRPVDNGTNGNKWWKKASPAAENPTTADEASSEARSFLDNRNSIYSGQGYPPDDYERNSHPMVEASVVDRDLLEAQIRDRVDREATQRGQRMVVEAQAASIQEEQEEEQQQDGKGTKCAIPPTACCMLIVIFASLGTLMAVLLTRLERHGRIILQPQPFPTTTTPTIPPPPPPRPIPSFPLDPPTDVPSPSPTTLERFQVERSIANVSSMERLRDPTSPQHAAVEWILQQDTLFPSLSPAEQQERFIVVTLYFATRGSVTWTKQGRFLTPLVHVCDWNDLFRQVLYGVYCEDDDQSNMVTRIDLRKYLPNQTNAQHLCGNCLTNPLLSFLLDDSGLSGSLPPELGFLLNLRVLDLSANSIEGTIPFSSLTQLPGLQHLLLYQNMLTGTIPTAIGQLNPQGLKFLDLDENTLEGTVPTEMGRLVKLERLYLNRNFGLSGTIPSEIGGLTNVRILDLGYNRLEGSLPAELSRCRSLRGLGLFSNKFSMTMTHALEALPVSVTALLLAFNNVTGSIPSTVSRHSHLAQLNLRSTGVSGAIPSELGRLTAMEEVDWFNNELTGTIPTEIGLLGELLLWNVGLNKLRGPLPSEMGLLTKLTHLDVSENSLTGIPAMVVGQLLSLDSLHLQNNDWTEVESVCTDGSGITNIGANSCEEVTRYPCSCCTFCCTSPVSMRERSCPSF